MNTGTTGAPPPEELERIYRLRFGEIVAFRARIWQVLAPRFFQQWVAPDDAVFDLGCGYGEFINAIAADRKFAMDLNAGARSYLAPDVTFIQQDCSSPWPLSEGSLDVVFSSNFLEHLPSKTHVDRTLEHARQAIRPGGRLILMGPNVRYLPGAYWDFWDHFVPISDLSIVEALRNRGFEIERVWGRFLPYTMAGRGRTGVSASLLEAGLRVYLSMPWLWPLFGRQFLGVARRPEEGRTVTER
jgi:SAM-dependent methyltransferase